MMEIELIQQQLQNQKCILQIRGSFFIGEIIDALVKMYA